MTSSLAFDHVVLRVTSHCLTLEQRFSKMVDSADVSDPSSLLSSSPMATSTVEANTDQLQMIAERVYGALQEQFQGQFAELHQKLDTAQTEVAVLRSELAQRGSGTGRTPKVNPPVVYDGKSKELADQFLHQISSAAKFQNFANDEQKILWAESFLSSQAHTWSATITSQILLPTRDGIFGWTGSKHSLIVSVLEILRPLPLPDWESSLRAQKPSPHIVRSSMML